MKERPILFSGPMVRALLDGTKTQTRRAIKPQFNCLLAIFPGVSILTNLLFRRKDQTINCPYGGPGDRLWVREKWRESGSGQAGDGKIPKTPVPVVYASDGDWGGPWRPSIHMPRWASRINLEVTDVRVERLQKITADDAIAEGIERVGGTFSCCPWRNYLRGTPGEMDMECSCPRRSFQTLWDSINAKRGFGWDTNCWVWVVEFEILNAEKALEGM